MPVSKKRKVEKQKRYEITEAMLNKIKREATEDAVQAAFAVFWHSLRDEFDFSIDDLYRLQARIDKVSEALNEGRITVNDIKDTLKQEDGILIVKGV